MKLLILLLLIGASFIASSQEIKPKPELLPTNESTKDHDVSPILDGEPFEITDSLEIAKNNSKDESTMQQPTMTNKTKDESQDESVMENKTLAAVPLHIEPTAELSAEDVSSAENASVFENTREPEIETKPSNKPIKQMELITPVPEPAIKFDNIESEDYGDIMEKQSAQPDELNTEVIEQLVDRFLNTGSIEKEQNITTDHVFTNIAAHTLVNSSNYWKTDKLGMPGSIKDEDLLEEWLVGYEQEANKVLREVALSGWRYFSSASPQSKKALDEAESVLAQFVQASAKQATQYDPKSITNDELKRKLNFVTFLGMSALSQNKAKEFSQFQAMINKNSKEATICDLDVPPPCALQKIDLVSIFRNEKDASRLQHLWVSYVTAVSKSKDAFNNIIKLSNEGASLNGFADAGAMWRSAFDLPAHENTPIEKQIEKIYETIKPFYQLIHAYMRRQLAGIYSNPAGLSKDGPIPGHLFGSVEGGDWLAHYEQTKPYEMETDFTELIYSAFNNQSINSKQMFITAYRYFKSSGFPPLPKSFWTNSIFSRVWSKDMICDPPAALDMRAKNDFRVKVCALVGEKDFELAHSLLVQTYYQYLYKDMDLLFREPASPVINDAIASAFAHMARNPNYLYSQHLIPADRLDLKDSQIMNRLYWEALENVVKMPFMIASDKWRYELFEGKIPSGKMNDRWWEIRNKYEGVRAPQPYNISNIDAFMHNSVAQVNQPATKSLISYVIKFQILKSMCPPGTFLTEGCILSEDTTQKLRETMSLGSAISWLQALEMITGETELDATAMLEYFEPLIQWLRNTNEFDQVTIGWDGPGTPFTPDEIPKSRSSGDGGNGLPSEDRVAFPGGDCVNGQECLLDSHCNGTVCVCNEGLFTLEIGNTFNCVPSNPADSGFGDGKGGLVIGLFNTEKETTPEPEAEQTTSTISSNPPSSASVTYLNSILLLCSMILHVVS